MKEALKKRGKKQGECVDKSWERGLYSLTKQACNSSSGLSGHAHTHTDRQTHIGKHKHTSTRYISPWTHRPSAGVRGCGIAFESHPCGRTDIMRELEGK